VIALYGRPMTMLLLSLLGCPRGPAGIRYDTADTSSSPGLGIDPVELMSNGDRTWVDVNVGYGGVVCAIDVDAHLGCWTATGAPWPFPDGAFSVVAVADVPADPEARPGFATWACAAGAVGLSCWDKDEVVVDVGGVWTDVGVGPEQACGVTGSGEVVCFERDDPTVVWTQDPGPLHDFGFAERAGCGLDASDHVRCWDAARIVDDGMTDGRMLDVSIRAHRACAVATDGSYHCWGQDTGVGDLGVPNLVAFQPGALSDCGVDTSGELYCGDGTRRADLAGSLPRPAFDTGDGMGVPNYGVTSTYGGLETDGYICAVDAAATVRCWHDTGPRVVGQPY
jgi:hypothetical protein